LTSGSSSFFLSFFSLSEINFVLVEEAFVVVAFDDTPYAPVSLVVVFYLTIL
jgi:hypothetical protein